MNANGIHDADNDQHGETCFEEGHVFGCQGAAGGEHAHDLARRSRQRAPAAFGLHSSTSGGWSMLRSAATGRSRVASARHN